MIVKWDVHSIRGKLAVAYVELPDDFMNGLRVLHTTLQCGDRVKSRLWAGISSKPGTLMSPFHFGTKQLAVVVWDDGSAGLWVQADLERE